MQIHGANGYLVDQFLRTTSNTRTDEYGETGENRLRFLKDVVNAVAEEVGVAEHTAIRLAPFLTARGMDCPDILPTILEAAEFLQARGIAYLHLVEADWDDAHSVHRSIPQGHPRTFAAPSHCCRQVRLDPRQWVLSARLCSPDWSPSAARSSRTPTFLAAWPVYRLRLRRKYAVRWHRTRIRRLPDTERHRLTAEESALTP